MSSLKASDLRLRRRAEALTAGQLAPPLNLNAVAEELGAEVQVVEMPPDLSGALLREPDHAVIAVNSRHTPAQRRYALAHEIAHLALHPEIGVHVDEGFALDLRAPTMGTAETIENVEANIFALHLLVPNRWLLADIDIEAFDFEDEDRLGALARRYGVTVPAMVRRLLMVSVRDSDRS